MIRGIFNVAVCAVVIDLAGVFAAKAPFCVPQVEFEVYQPKGFRVTMPHVEGMQMFAFHATINRPMRNYEVGQYFKDVMCEEDGRWVYEEKSAKLKKGDVIYYWVYVLHDRLGYRRDDQEYKVTELITQAFPEPWYPPPPSNGDDIIFAQQIPQQAARPRPPTTVRTTTTPHPRTPSQDNDKLYACTSNLTTCERTVLRITSKLIDIDINIEQIRDENALLKSIINRLPGGKKLTMSGRISREDKPATVVSFILHEKLNLSPMVVSAIRNPDLSITFQLSNVDEVIAVITGAKEKLKDSMTVSITY